MTGPCRPDAVRLRHESRPWLFLMVMGECNIIVIGASAGGLKALCRLVAGLPADLAGAVFVVLHIGVRPSSTPEILSRSGPLPAIHPADGEMIRPGCIYVAPPDHHLLVMAGQVQLSHGPRENHTRPAIDPLFRSAAEFYGPRVVGVILSGTHSDGTAGLCAIKRRGGTTVVQDPEEAEFSGMPSSALRTVAVDHCLPVAAMADLITGLVGVNSSTGPDPGRPAPPSAPEEEDMTGGYELNQPVALTCPECGGAMRESLLNGMPYFTCHIGHRLAADNMEVAQFEQLEQALDTALRTLNERAALCRRMATAAHQRGWNWSARHWEAALAEAEERAEILRRFLEQSWRQAAPQDPGADEAAG